MKSYKIALILSLFIVFTLIIGFLFLANLSWLEIENYRIEGVSSYSIKSELIEHIGSNYLFLNIGDLKKTIKLMPYVSDVSIEFDDNTLIAIIDTVEKGIVAYSEEDAFFFDGNEILNMDYRDVYAVKDFFLILDIRKDYLEYMQKFGFDSDFKVILDTLYNLDKESTLIPRAHFYDNKYNTTKCLTLDLEELNSILIVTDFTKLNVLSDVLDYISMENDLKQYDTIFSSDVYQLKSTGLVRIKR